MSEVDAASKEEQKAVAEEKESAEADPFGLDAFLSTSPKKCASWRSQHLLRSHLAHGHALSAIALPGPLRLDHLIPVSAACC